MLDRRAFERFSGLVSNTLGIRMPSSKYAFLESRLVRRMRELGLDSVDAYEARLFGSAGAGELQHFIDIVTTNKTDFFRESQQFELLTGRVLPELIRERGRGGAFHLNLWCAGCSSGEEVYSLSMVLAEYAREHPRFGFSVLGTDISLRVLGHALKAVYPESAVEPVPSELRRRYLLRSKDRRERLVRVTPDLRERTRFSRLNFMDSDYAVPDHHDVIFFRNVMIYFDKPTQEQVVNRMARRLRPGGYLFIGLSESLAGARVPLESAGVSVFRKPA